MAMVGRPRSDKSGAKKEVKISSYVTSQMASDIQDLARIKQMTVATFVVNILDEYIEPRREKINAFRELQKEV